MEAGARPSDAGILRAIDAQTAALAVMVRAGPHMDTAYLAQSLLESGGFAGTDRYEVREVARHHLARSLTLAPGNARGWMMLAGLRLGDGDEAGAASALAVSFAADPHLPRLAPFRWPMTLRLGGRVGRETRERAALEFLSFFRTQPEIATRIALRQDRLSELSALAAQRPEDRDRLRLMLARTRPAGTGA